MASKRLFVIDADAGVDDAMAIMMVLARPDIRVLGITSVNGNASIDRTTENICRILEECGAADSIPVYSGAARPLVSPLSHSLFFHGDDGLGGISSFYPPLRSKVAEQEHAVNALVRLSREFDGQITLLAVGPLTNLALASRMDPGFSRRLKNVVIMGGNIEGRGNASPAAEFNFHGDPEAAHVVLKEFSDVKPTLVTMESCGKELLGEDWWDELRGKNTKKAKFLKDFSQFSFDFVKREGIPMLPYDQAAAAVAISPDTVIRDQAEVRAEIELHGTLTRGAMVCDWKNLSAKAPNIIVALRYNIPVLKDMLMEAVLK
eukprot:m.4605 g.4605  ORF g.4605 m.4605 type:complete len:318 (+) comp11009_c0_seq1:118-1071(+)